MTSAVVLGEARTVMQPAAPAVGPAAAMAMPAALQKTRLATANLPLPAPAMSMSGAAAARTVIAEPADHAPHAPHAQFRRATTGMPGLAPPQEPKNNTMRIATPVGYSSRPPRKVWPVVLGMAMLLGVGGGILSVTCFGHDGAGSTGPAEARAPGSNAQGGPAAGSTAGAGSAGASGAGTAGIGSAGASAVGATSAGTVTAGSAGGASAGAPGGVPAGAVAATGGTPTGSTASATGSGARPGDPSAATAGPGAAPGHGGSGSPGPSGAGRPPDPGTPAGASGGANPPGPTAGGGGSGRVSLTFPPAATRTAHLAIESVPTGATVRGPDGAALGKTPLALDWPASTAPVRFELRLVGYKPKQKQTVINGNTRLVIELEHAAVHRGTGSGARPAGNDNGLMRPDD